MVPTETETIKLQLGCRTRAMPGWRNFDCDPHDGVDIVGDIRDLSMFADGSVSEIYASHVAEHVPHAETLPMLKEWLRVLAPGGKLYIAVPDFARAIELYEKIGLDNWIVNFLCGDQVYKTAYHYSLFDELRLFHLLHQAGFTDAFRVEEFPIGDESDCSTMISTFDLQPVSLNVIATR